MPPFSHTQPTPTPREEWQKKRDERKLAESPDAQESIDSETDVYTQESEKDKEEKSPPHPKKRKKKVKVVKSKEYKIQRPKKRAIIRKCSLCSEKFSSQKELNDHIAGHHNFKFSCSDRKYGKAFGSLESLKKHQLHHREMGFLCSVDFCVAEFPFPSDLSSHQSLHLQEKKFVCPYPTCGTKYKTKPELNRHYKYRHKQKLSKATIDKCSVV